MSSGECFNCKRPHSARGTPLCERCEEQYQERKKDAPAAHLELECACGDIFDTAAKLDAHLVMVHDAATSGNAAQGEDAVCTHFSPGSLHDRIERAAYRAGVKRERDAASARIAEIEARRRADWEMYVDQGVKLKDAEARLKEFDQALCENSKAIELSEAGGEIDRLREKLEKAEREVERYRSSLEELLDCCMANGAWADRSVYEFVQKTLAPEAAAPEVEGKQSE